MYSIAMLIGLVLGCSQALAQGGVGVSGGLSGLLGDRTLDDFKGTRKRPLFTPARHPPRPPPPPPPPPEPKVRKPKPVKVEPPKPPSLRLVGVVMMDDSKLALLLDTDRNVRRVGVGDEVEGWSVVKLEPSLVELRLDGERSVYRMFRASGNDRGGDSDRRGRDRGRRR